MGHPALPQDDRNPALRGIRRKENCCRTLSLDQQCDERSQGCRGSSQAGSDCTQGPLVRQGLVRTAQDPLVCSAGRDGSPSTLCHSRPGLQSHQGHLWDLLLDLLDHWDRLHHLVLLHPACLLGNPDHAAAVVRSRSDLLLRIAPY